VYCSGAAQIPLLADTVRDALLVLEQTQPAFYRNVCDETGTLRRHLNVFVNSDNILDREGIDTALRPGDVVTILPAVSGGCKWQIELSSPSAPRRACLWPRRRKHGASSR
jgi:molybdopterin synthase sulfur carrier subunit